MNHELEILNAVNSELQKLGLKTELVDSFDVAVGAFMQHIPAHVKASDNRLRLEVCDDKLKLHEVIEIPIVGHAYNIHTVIQNILTFVIQTLWIWC